MHYETWGFVEWERGCLCRGSVIEVFGYESILGPEDAKENECWAAAAGILK